MDTPCGHDNAGAARQALQVKGVVRPDWLGGRLHVVRIRRSVREEVRRTKCAVPQSAWLAVQACALFIESAGLYQPSISPFSLPGRRAALLVATHCNPRVPIFIYRDATGLPVFRITQLVHPALDRSVKKNYDAAPVNKAILRAPIQGSDDNRQMCRASAPDVVELQFPSGCQRVQTCGGVQQVTTVSVQGRRLKGQRSRNQLRLVRQRPTSSLVMQHGYGVL